MTLEGSGDASKKEYTPEFKDQAVRFVLEEIAPDESREQACERLPLRLSVKPGTLDNWVKQSGVHLHGIRPTRHAAPRVDNHSSSPV